MLKVLIFISSLLRWTSAQLTGNITSPGNPYVVTVSITNPSQNTISILAWNNVFDFTTQLPVPFSVKDDQGNDVQLASTNAMRAGMSDSDLFALNPGQTFTRVIDMRQIMQNIPSGPSTPLGGGLQPKVYTVHPPASFKGIVGTASVPLGAAADLSGDPPTLGNFAAANLQDVTLQANALRLSSVFPVIGDVDSTFMSPADGIHVNADCAAQNLTDDSNALFDAGIYANSLAMAATDSSSPLFPLFFSRGSREVVGLIAGAAAKSIRGAGPHVDHYCTDMQNMCGDPNILGYSFSPSFLGDAYIVLCPSARALGRAPQPCYSPETGSERSASTSHVLFHLIMTLNNVVTAVMASSVYGTQACEQLSNSTLIDPTKNPDSFAQLAIAHWGYGLGGAPYNGPSCLPAGGVLPDMQKRAVPAKRRKALGLEKPLAREVMRTPPETLAKRQSHPIITTQDCSAAELDMIEISVANAQALATFASSDLSSASSSDRWTTFFNGDRHVRAQVKNAYEAVARWNTTTPYADDVFYRCDPLRKSPYCKSQSHIRIVQFTGGSIGYVAVIVACPEYFYQAISLECIDPSAVPSRYLTGLAQDQSGSMLHELLHIKTVVNAQTQIMDGSPLCYGWSCMTQNAHDRVLPGFPAVNLPENVATNYEYFAYAARAARGDCSWTEYAGHAWGSIVAAHWMVLFGRK